MSFSIMPSDVIRKHPTNHSTSKEIHMFSKTKRFISPNPECPNAFYSYDSQLSNRKASFGYGNKSDFTRTLTASPASTKYNSNTTTFVDMTAQHGRSFGTARDKLPDNSYLVPQLQAIPGPGQYDNEKAKKKNFSFTAREKPADMIEQNLTYKKAPGPGAHNGIEFNPKNGRFAVGKYNDSTLCTIHPATERFLKTKQSPGPSSYQEGDKLNGEAKYVLSHRKSNGRRLFSKTARGSIWKKITTPGPGTYAQTSQFGHYGNSKYYKTLQK